MQAEQNTQSAGPHLLTIEEIIAAARSSRATIYREISAGRLKTLKLGARRYTTPEYMQEWIATLASAEAS